VRIDEVLSEELLTFSHLLYFEYINLGETKLVPAMQTNEDTLFEVALANQSTPLYCREVGMDFHFADESDNSDISDVSSDDGTIIPGSIANSFEQDTCLDSIRDLMAKSLSGEFRDKLRQIISSRILTVTGLQKYIEILLKHNPDSECYVLDSKTKEVLSIMENILFTYYYISRSYVLHGTHRQ
jgi:hypothetical protein